jgi:predicted regulator of Ras-like GTPase activity (Roadblock/LC7/MglB family)
VKTESANHVSALTGRIMSDTESSEEEMTYDELAMSYCDLISKNTELTQRVEKQVIVIAQLQDERFENVAQISKLNDELTKLNSQLEHVKEQDGIMIAGTDDSAWSKPMLEH